MKGLGTLMNAGLIIAGGLLGILFKKGISEKMEETLLKANGVSVMFLGIAGTLEKMLVVSEKTVSSTGSMMIISLCLGAVIGELIDLDRKMETFGEWLKKKTGNARDAGFTNAFVTASLTVCIGAMAIVGAIQDGVYGDYSILLTKGILDFVIIMMMASSLGKGALFSFIPVAALQGTVTLLASAASAYITEAALHNLSLVGSVLIFCVGVNLLWPKTIRVANLLPAVLIAMIYAYVR